MAKVLVVGDSHFANHRPHSRIMENGRNSRLQDLIDVIHQIQAYCVRERVDYVVSVGDILHRRFQTDNDVYSATWRTWKSLADSVQELFIVIGNHDVWGRDAISHSLYPFESFATVPVSPTVLARDNFTLALIPFTADTSYWKDYVRNVLPPVDLVFSHQGISQGLLGAYQVQIKAEVDLNDIPGSKARHWIFGHYHKPQTLCPNVHYVGSIAQLDYGERDEEKSFMVIDTDEWTIQRIPTRAPRFHLFSSVEEFEEWKRNNPDSADFVRVQAKREEVEELKRQNPDIQVTVKHEKKEKSRVSGEALVDDSELLSDYVEQKSETDKYLEMGKKLLFGERST